VNVRRPSSKGWKAELTIVYIPRSFTCLWLIQVVRWPFVDCNNSLPVTMSKPVVLNWAGSAKGGEYKNGVWGSAPVWSGDRALVGCLWDEVP